MTMIWTTAIALGILGICSASAGAYAPHCGKNDLPPSVNKTSIPWDRASTYYVFCNHGYAPIGVKVKIECIKRGVWRTNCTLITCPLPLDPSGGGSVTVTAGGKLGSVATYTCPEGTLLQGDNHRVCQTNGTFSGTEGRCVPLCPTPDLPENVVVLSNGGGRMSFACQYDTFVYLGKKHIACQAGGTWSSPVGTCVLKKSITCGVPEIQHSVHKEGGTLGYDQVYEPNCEDGYRYHATQPMKCLANGTVSGVPGECRPVSIGTTPFPQNNSVIPPKKNYEKVIGIVIGTTGFITLLSSALLFLLYRHWSRRGSYHICKREETELGVRERHTITQDDVDASSSLDKSKNKSLEEAAREPSTSVVSSDHVNNSEYTAPRPSFSFRRIIERNTTCDVLYMPNGPTVGID